MSTSSPVTFNREHDSAHGRFAHPDRGAEAVRWPATHFVAASASCGSTANRAVDTVRKQWPDNGPVLSIMEMPEAGRQVIYGGVIILMLPVYVAGSR